MKIDRWFLVCGVWFALSSFFAASHAATTTKQTATDSTFKYYESGNDIILKGKLLNNTNPQNPGKVTAGVFLPKLPNPDVLNDPTKYSEIELCPLTPNCPDIGGELAATSFNGDGSQIFYDPSGRGGREGCPSICRVNRETGAITADNTIARVQYPVCPNNYISIASFNPGYDLVKSDKPNEATFPVADFDTFQALLDKGYNCKLDTTQNYFNISECLSTPTDRSNIKLSSFSGKVNPKDNFLDFIIRDKDGLTGIGRFLPHIKAYSSMMQGMCIWQYSAISNCYVVNNFYQYPENSGAYYRAATSCSPALQNYFQVEQTFQYYKCTQPAGYQKQDNIVMQSVLCAHPIPVWYRGTQMLNVNGTNDKDQNPYTTN